MLIRMERSRYFLKGACSDVLKGVIIFGVSVVTYSSGHHRAVAITPINGLSMTHFE